LAAHFTVVRYDRRGRGDSGDAAAYAMERGIEDIEAVAADYRTRLDALIEADRRGAAVKQFMSEGANVPGVFVAMMRFMPAWSKLTSAAHTLPYDVEALAAALPNARHRTLAGQTHLVKAKALAPVLREFFEGGGP
jgi:hypothetical protein